MAHRAGLAAVLEFIMSSPELKPNKITYDEDKNKSRIELRLTEPLLIANKKMRIYSSASIVASGCYGHVPGYITLKQYQPYP
jgi:hypothetical protein